eukprot:898100-Prymnesium_polylepis.2
MRLLSRRDGENTLPTFLAVGAEQPQGCVHTRGLQAASSHGDAFSTWADLNPGQLAVDRSLQLPGCVRADHATQGVDTLQRKACLLAGEREQEVQKLHHVAAAAFRRLRCMSCAAFCDSGELQIAQLELAPRHSHLRGPREQLKICPDGPVVADDHLLARRVAHAKQRWAHTGKRVEQHAVG